jgi:hypothetical protein
MFSICYNCNQLLNINHYSHCDECIDRFCLNCFIDKQLIKIQYIDSMCKKCSKNFNKKLFYCKKHKNYIKTPLSKIYNDCVELLLPLPHTPYFNLPI